MINIAGIYENQIIISWTGVAAILRQGKVGGVGNL